MHRIHEMWNNNNINDPQRITESRSRESLENLYKNSLKWLKSQLKKEKRVGKIKFIVIFLHQFIL